MQARSGCPAPKMWAATTRGRHEQEVVPWLWGLPPTDRLYYPLYAACVELGVRFCTQVGHTGPLGPSEPGRPIPYLDQVALDFPELDIVAGRRVSGTSVS